MAQLSQRKPRATFTYSTSGSFSTSGRAAGPVRVSFQSSAKRIVVSYKAPRKARAARATGKLVTRTAKLRVRDGRAAILLPVGSTAAKARAVGYRGHRGGSWVRIRHLPASAPAPFVAPAAPGTPRLTPRDGLIEASWDPPTNDGGAAVVSYTATAQPSGASCQSGQPGCAITGLTNGSEYTVTLVARNIAGTSMPSEPATARPAGVPSAPQAALGTRFANSLPVSWSPPLSDGGSPVLGYTATASPSGASCQTGPSGTGCTITGLPYGHLYQVTVTALNAMGASTPALAGHSATLPTVRSVAAGGMTSCAIADAGTLWCWGRSDTGQLPGQGPVLQPARVAGLDDVTSVAIGSGHTCAITRDGRLWCWGANEKGQLGTAGPETSNAPLQVVGIPPVRLVAVGAAHTCAVDLAGGLWCWGLGEDGQLGSGPVGSTPVPTQVGGLSGVVAIAAGDYHTCAVASGGALSCWGANWDGQLGDGTTTGRDRPDPALYGEEVNGVAAGNGHTCAQMAQGGVQCWGSNFAGQLGDGTATDSPTPVWAGVVQSRTLALGASSSCSLGETAVVSCWGAINQGAPGNAVGAPTEVAGLEDAVGLAAGWDHACALRSNGEVVCWGEGDSGELGDGAGTRSALPVKVSWR